MSWFYLSLIPPMLWGMVNTIDKVVVERYVTKAMVYLVFTGLASLIPIIILPAFVDLQKLSVFYLMLSLLTGVLYITYTYFFFRALTISDAPVVANMLLLVPIVSTILGTIIFDELFRLVTYLGIALVIVGVLGTSIERRKMLGQVKTVLTPALALMTISALITGADYALQKHILTVTDEVTLFYWGRVGVLFATVCLLSIFQQVRKDFVGVVRAIPNKIIPISIGNETLDMVATFTLLTAFARGPLSLIATVISIQPLFVLILVVALNTIKPRLIPSSLDKRNFWLRFVSISIAASGIYFISMSAT